MTGSSNITEVTSREQRSAVETTDKEPHTQTIQSMIDTEEIRENINKDQDPQPGENHKNHAIVHTPNTCPQCDNDIVTESEKHAEITCEECGEIIETREFPQTLGRDKFIFTMDERSTSVTDDSNAGIQLDGLGGRIDFRDKDPYNNTLTSLKRAKFHRLREIDRDKASNPQKDTYRYAVSDINRMASGLSIPNYVRDAASDIFREILSEYDLSGLPIEVVTTASLHIACEMKSVSRGFEELTEVSHADSLLVKDIKPAVGCIAQHDRYTKTVTEYVDYFSDDTRVTDENIRDAKKLLRTVVDEEVLEQYDLQELTTAAVYAVTIRSQQHLRISELTDVLNVSPSGVRNSYQLFLEASVT